MAATPTSLRRGFTLIELLVVVAIIGLLATIIISSLQHAQQTGGSSTNLSNLRQFELAFENYYQANGSYPNTGSPGALYCIGSSTCTYKGTALAGNATVNAALQPLLGPSYAAVSNFVINVAGQATQGSFYECLDSACSSARLEVIELGNDACQVGQPSALGENSKMLAAPAPPLTDGTYTLCGDSL